MERYLGIDPHRDSCTLALVSRQGKKVEQLVVPTEGSELVKTIRDLRGPLHVCVEEGEWSEWISEILTPWVARLVVCRPQARRGPKSDACDARELAERLRTDRTGPAVYKPSVQWARLREAVRLESKLTQDLTRTKLRLNSLYRRRGVTCPNGDIYLPRHRGEWVSQLPPSGRPCAELWGEQIDLLGELHEKAERQMHAAAAKFPIWKTLQTAPGIAEKRAAILLATVVTPHRFRSKRQFWSYCGLGIVTRSSSDWVQQSGHWVRAPVIQTRGLNRASNRPLKAVFKGASQSARSMLAPNPFRDHYDRMLEAGTKPNLAQLNPGAQAGGDRPGDVEDRERVQDDELSRPISAPCSSRLQADAAQENRSAGEPAARSKGRGRVSTVAIGPSKTMEVTRRKLGPLTGPKEEMAHEAPLGRWSRNLGHQNSLQISDAGTARKTDLTTELRAADRLGNGKSRARCQTSRAQRRFVLTSHPLGRRQL